MKSAIHILTGLILIGGTGLFADEELPGQLELRRLRNDTEACVKTLRNPQADSVLRRTAFRLLLESRKEADIALTEGLTDRDAAIRRLALYETFNRKGVGAFEILKNGVADPDFETAKTVLECAKNFPDKKMSAELLKLINKNSRFQALRREANRIVDFPFHRDNKRIKDNPTYDHDIIMVKSIPLPQQGWRFKVDPMVNGHHKGFFKPEFNDSKWKLLKIGAWEKQGFAGYDGIAWYRFRFKMPEKIDSNAVELTFGAVDETAWVWLNGIYVGQHDIGPNGWDKPFVLDVTGEIRWNTENILVVRVEDTIAAGGIWKPVIINILK